MVSDTRQQQQQNQQVHPDPNTTLPTDVTAGSVSHTSHSQKKAQAAGEPRRVRFSGEWPVFCRPLDRKACADVICSHYFFRWLSLACADVPHFHLLVSLVVPIGTHSRKQVHCRYRYVLESRLNTAG